MIEVRHLRKRYGSTLALDDVSFTVETGSICGLLGPNGAGKSTTMNIMTGCLAATSGEVRYDGLEIYADMKSVKRRIGYLPEQPPLYPDMTVAEYLMFVARAKGIARADVEAGVVAAAHACGLDSVLPRLIKNLSKGYKQRVGIAQALLGDPHTVILDEPTVGLDPLQIIEIRDLIHAMAQQRTVVVSSHILSEIRMLCDQIVIISKGRLIADDTPDNLERRLAGSRTTALTVRADADEAVRIASSVEGVATAAADDAFEEEAQEGCTRIVVESQDAGDVREGLFRAFVREDIVILEMTTKRASLEDVFVELAEGGAASAEAAEAAEAAASPDDADAAAAAAALEAAAAAAPVAAAPAPASAPAASDGSVAIPASASDDGEGKEGRPC